MYIVYYLHGPVKQTLYSYISCRMLTELTDKHQELPELKYLNKNYKKYIKADACVL